MNSALSQQQREEKAKVTSSVIYKGRAFEVRCETLLYQDGKPHSHETVHHPGAVVILAIDQSEDLYLIKQWRRSIQKIIFELPAGTLEKNESPLECAKRELQEEIGFSAKNWTPLGGFYSAPGFCDEYLHLFLATHLSESPLQGDEHEGIDVVKLSLKKALSLIDHQEIYDAKTLLAILAYNRLKQRGK